MASVLHGSVRTTPRLPAEVQASKETGRVLAARCGLSPEDGRQVAQGDHDGRRAARKRPIVHPAGAVGCRLSRSREVALC